VKRKEYLQSVIGHVNLEEGSGDGCTGAAYTILRSSGFPAFRRTLHARVSSDRDDAWRRIKLAA